MGAYTEWPCGELRGYFTPMPWKRTLVSVTLRCGYNLETFLAL